MLCGIDTFQCSVGLEQKNRSALIGNLSVGSQDPTQKNSMLRVGAKVLLGGVLLTSSVILPGITVAGAKVRAREGESSLLTTCWSECT